MRPVVSLVCCAVIALVAGCSANAAPSVTTPATTRSINTHAAARTSSATAAVDAAAAIAALDDARSVSYQQMCTTTAGNQSVDVERKVAVDKDQGLTRADLTMPDGTSADAPKIHLVMISSADGIVLTSPEWAGDRAGVWMRIDAATAEAQGLTPGNPGTVPRGLDTFTPTGTASSPLVTGTIPARDAVYALGVTGILKDDELLRSLRGEVPATVTIDPASGAIQKLEVTGEGGTVSGESAEHSRDFVEAVFRGTHCTISIDQIDQDVNIVLPDKSKIRDAE